MDEDCYNALSGQSTKSEEETTPEWSMQPYMFEPLTSIK